MSYHISIIPYLLVLFIPTVSAQELKFTQKGNFVRSLQREQFVAGKLNSIKAKTISLYNPWRKKEKTYLVFSFTEVMNYIFQDEWKKSKKVYFVSNDGYRQTMDIKTYLKMDSRKQLYIAFSEKGKNGFAGWIKNGKRIDPGPFYLVWSGFSPEDRIAHNSFHKWPHQVKSINLL